jgi:hypothetical protein
VLQRRVYMYNFSLNNRRFLILEIGARQLPVPVKIAVVSRLQWLLRWPHERLTGYSSTNGQSMLSYEILMATGARGILHPTLRRLSEYLLLFLWPHVKS